MAEIYTGLSDRPYVSNNFLHINVEQNAHVDHLKIQNEGKFAFHQGSSIAWVYKDATYHSFVLSLGAKLSRNNVHVKLARKGSATRVDGLYTLKDQAQSDHYTKN